MKLVFPSAPLLEAQGHQEFLRVLYELNKKNSSAFSFNYMAQRCGFSSKSFLKDVMSKKKKLSLDSAYKITKGLNFPSTWGRYFLEIVKKDLTADQDLAVNSKEQTRLKTKLAGKNLEVKQDDVGHALFQRIQHWPYVYAALGTVETGASALDIEKRTGLSEGVVEGTLEILVTEKLVVKKGRRYYPASSEIFFEKLGKSEFFKNFFCRSILKSQELALKKFGSPDALFYSMALSIKPEKMPDFRLELAELLDKYTTEIEDPNGTRVASLNCAFHLT